MKALYYGKIFHYPRQILKYALSFLYPIIIRIWPLPKVLTIDETIDCLISTKASIARFGDGEILYITDKRSLPFQKYNAELGERLKAVLKSNSSNLLVGLPEGYRKLVASEPKHLVYWKSQIVWTYPRIKKFIDGKRNYYNANITRFYYGFGDRKASEKYFSMIRLLWENRKILLIEGEKSRFGVQNDLLDNAISIERILGPATNAFDKFAELLNTALLHDREKLVLVAMGPTAKALVFELANAGFQAVDIGNLDIEYEWFRINATERVKIPGKYTSEAIGGRVVGDMNDSKYLGQIIAKCT